MEEEINESVTREEFEALKKYVFTMKDILEKCNLKMDAPFEDLELEDDYDFEDDEETEPESAM